MDIPAKDLVIRPMTSADIPHVAELHVCSPTRAAKSSLKPIRFIEDPVICQVPVVVLFAPPHPANTRVSDRT